MPSNTESFGMNGVTPALFSYVFATAVGTATMNVTYALEGHDVDDVQLSVTTTPATFRTLLTNAGVTWDKAIVGASINTVGTTDVYYNTSGEYDGTYDAAPDTTKGKYIPVGDYRTDPYKLGSYN